MRATVHPRRRRARRTAVATLAVTAMLGGTAAAANALFTVGPEADGSAIIPTGYRVAPAGLQTDLGDLPFASALSPDGRTMLVSNDGQGEQALQAVDTATGRVVQTIPYASPQALYQGLTYSPDGTRAYASAGGNNKIRTYTVTGQQLTEGAPIALPTTASDGTKVNFYPAGLAVSPDGRTGYVADQLADAVTTLDLTHGRVLATTAVGHNPLQVAVSDNGRTLWVAEQGESVVDELDVSDPLTPTLVRRVQVDAHPNALLLRGGHLYVANGDADTVSEIDTAGGYVDRTLDLSPYENAPVGSNPDGLALSADGRTLYVTEAGANSVDVVRLGASGAPSNPGMQAPSRPRATPGAAPSLATVPRSKHQPKGKAGVVGSIPTGWYPSSLQLSRDGRELLVTNAKGLGAGPNDGPGYPDPTSPAPTAPDQYSGSMIVGTLSTIPVPGAGTLARYTTQVVRNDGFARGATPRGNPGGTPVPARVGQPSPIKHVIYVIKENRTYDQVLGSLGQGNGDPALNLFGDESAPNQRRLARQFTTLDNFYADAEVSADGWNWSTAANANRYVQGTWTANYSGRNHPYEFEGGNLATAPNADPRDAYLWDRLDDAGVDYRNFGFFTFGAANTVAPTEPNLVAHSDPAYHGFDLACPDHPDSFAPVTAPPTATRPAQPPACGAPRYAQWRKDFDSDVATNAMPAVQFVRFPSDHTSGTTPGYPTPQAYMADNDWALGDLVDSVSHSQFWASTAIFVLEDDAQNGPDHVDAHRTVAQVISPYTETGRVDSTLYSTTSMLRTMELISGLGPLTQFDAYATPMYNSFTATPNLRPYSSVRPSYDMTTVNAPTAPMAARSAAQDLTQPDRVDERTFNQAIWQSVRGAGSPMPAPRHTVRVRGTDSDG